MDNKYHKFSVNKNIIILCYVVVIIILFLFWVFYTPTPPLNKDEEINWIVTGGSFDLIAGNNVQYSYDGFNFQSSKGNSLNDATKGDYGLTPDKSKFIWIMGGTDIFLDKPVPNILLSYNGEVWVKDVSNLEAIFNIGFGYDENDNPRWIGVGSGAITPDRTSNIISSKNGTDWDNTYGISFGLNGGGFAVAYGKNNSNDNMWVIGGDNTDGDRTNDNILYGYDDMVWKESTGAYFYGQLGPLVGCRCAAYGTSDKKNINRWVAGGIDQLNNTLLYSDDGISWEHCTGTKFERSCNGVAFGKTVDEKPRWVAVGGYNGGGQKNTILYSDDGISWNTTTGVQFVEQGFGVEFGKSKGGFPMWLVVGEEVNNYPAREVLYSFDGIEWLTTEDSMKDVDLFNGGVASNVLKHGVKNIFT